MELALLYYIQPAFSLLAAIIMEPYCPPSSHLPTTFMYLSSYHSKWRTNYRISL